MFKLFKAVLVSLGLGLMVISQAQAGTVILKILGVNPSKDQTQEVVMKAYLPKEIKPSDIVDKEDLEVIYDTEEGAYYVYGNYQLGPKEVVEKTVELTDIWTISEEELETLRNEAVKTVELLQNTDFEERVKFLKSSIEYKLNKIIEIQKVPAINSQKHISDYRNNLELLKQVKDDLFLTRSLLAKAKVLPSATVWKVFFFIIAFLVVLAVTLYLVWHKQVKTMIPSVLNGEPEEEKSKEAVPQRFKMQNEDRGTEDIREIMDGDQEDI